MSEQLLIALPKGRLQDQTLALLEQAGITCSAIKNGSRSLILHDDSGDLAFVPLKPVDIPVYVELGAIDVGIVGTDVLRESERDLYEPLDLKIGKCRLVLAGHPGSAERAFMQIATKYPNTARRYFAGQNKHVNIVKLDGSVEIAPLLGLADAIVDLVETGRTLKENGLVVIEEIAQVTAKLIVNRTGMKMKGKRVGELISQLDRVVYANT